MNRGCSFSCQKTFCKSMNLLWKGNSKLFPGVVSWFSRPSPILNIHQPLASDIVTQVVEIRFGRAAHWKIHNTGRRQTEHGQKLQIAVNGAGPGIPGGREFAGDFAGNHDQKDFG
jgi:hypothetical protein